MAKIDSFYKEKLAEISRKDLEKLVLKAAASNPQFYNYLIINYLDRAYGEADLFEKTKAEIDTLFYKKYKGYSIELVAANMLAACNKKIVAFDKVCKDKTKVIDLILFVLEVPFSNKNVSFSTCFTKFNYQISLLIKKAINLLENKVHPDYHIQYVPILNNYLQTLHRTCDYLDYITALPSSITK
jgi:hypothetical protein